MKEEDILLRKKEIIAPIIISHKEALEMKERSLDKRELRCKEIEDINKELKHIIEENVEERIGKIMRDFEILNPCSKEIKNYMIKLWVFMNNEIAIRFRSPKENYIKEEIKKVNEINKLNKRIESLKDKQLALEDRKNVRD